MHARLVLALGYHGVVIALGVDGCGLYQDLLWAQFDAETAALAALWDYVYLANGDPDGGGVERSTSQYVRH